MKTVSVYYPRGAVAEEAPLTHSGRNNKQIERVNKWSRASPPPFPLTLAAQVAAVTTSSQHADDRHE